MSASIWNPQGTQAVPALPAVNPVTFIKGTATIPGINFVGDTNTGIWSQADGYINFAVNGVNVLTIDPSGNTVGNKFASGVELSIASAATCDIGSIVSNNLLITGSAGISSFGTNYRGPVFIRFAAALILSHSANLICPGNASINVAPGDTCIVTPKATNGVADGWAVISYQSSAPLLNAVTSINNGQLAGMRNRIINGDFTVWQRGTNITPAGSFQYAADRWFVYNEGAIPGSIVRGAGPDQTSDYSLEVFGSAGNTSVVIGQRIESYNVTSMCNKTVTVSGRVWTSTSKAVICVLSYANSRDNFIVTNIGTSLIPAVAGWRYFAATFNVPGVKTGLQLEFAFGATGPGTSVAVGKIQIEEGAVATPFEQRSYGLELALCERYYEIVPFRISGTGGAAQSIVTQVFYKATKRTVPSIILYTPSSGSWAVDRNYLQGLAVAITNAYIDSYTAIIANAEL